MAHAPITKRKKSVDPDLHKFQGKESILTSQIELYVEEEKPRIPDGGWGWVIVLAAFMLNTISEGVSFSFGLMYIEFLVEFGASKSATSWIGSLFLALPLLTGPIGSAMVDRYGCIPMTCLGSVICTIGFTMSSYARSITVMYITFGIIGGVGRCLTFVTAVVSIAFWFEKRRTIALGLAASGAGFGTIVFAPLTTMLLNEYHWRGTMLILAGCFFNMCVCGVVMRDPAWIIMEEKEKKTIKKQANVTTNNGVPSRLKTVKESLTQGGDAKSLFPAHHQPNLSPSTKFRSNIDLPTYLRDHEKIPIDVLKRTSQNQRLYTFVLDNFPGLLSTKSSSEQDLHRNQTTPRKISIRPLHHQQAEPIPEQDEDKEEDVVNGSVWQTRPLLSESRRDSERKRSHTYLDQLRMRKSSTVGKDLFSISETDKSSAVSCPNVYGNVLSVEMTDGDPSGVWYVDFFRSIKSLLNLSLFLELHFFLLALSTTILFIWFIVPYFYLAEHMTRIGYSDAQNATILSVIGMTNTIGMVFLGWAGNRLNIAKTYAVCLILCGISTGMIMFFGHIYWFLIVNSGLFGLFFASCFSLLPSLLAELVPLDDFTMAYGLVLLCEGIGNLTGPPLAGLLFDVTGSWDQSFYQAAIWIVICGVLIGIIPFTENKKMIGSGPILNEIRSKTRGTV